MAIPFPTLLGNLGKNDQEPLAEASLYAPQCLTCSFAFFTSIRITVLTLSLFWVYTISMAQASFSHTPRGYSVFLCPLSLSEHFDATPENAEEVRILKANQRYHVLQTSYWLSQE